MLLQHLAQAQMSQKVLSSLAFIPCPPLPVTDQSQDSSASVPTKNWPNLKLGLIFSFLSFSAYQGVKCVIQLYLLVFLIRAFSKMKGIKIATFV